MADVETTNLHKQDFYLWALDQARAVRDLRDAAAGNGEFVSALNAIDWDNVIEELEGLATGARSELHRRLATIVEHLVKLELSGAADPRRGWEETVQRSRRESALLLEDNPSLRREVPTLVESRILTRAATDAVNLLVRYGEVRRGAKVPAYTQSQLLEDWWPDQTEPSP